MIQNYIAIAKALKINLYGITACTDREVRSRQGVFRSMSAGSTVAVYRWDTLLHWGSATLLKNRESYTQSDLSQGLRPPAVGQ